MKVKFKLSIFILVIFTLTCCISVTEKTGKALDGSAFKEKTISLFKSAEIELSILENKEKEKSIIINIYKYPMMKLRASYPEENGDFHFTSLEYLAGSTHGWNEFSLLLLGTGNFLINDDKSASFEIIEKIEKTNISSGKIHRYDTRLTGVDALTALQNRNERITALARWMHSKNVEKHQTMKDFSVYWKPVLLPEIVSKKDKPAAWRLADDKFERAEDINWNTGYTQRIFPEELHPIRDSGTLLRDWEEALYWIYLEYEWENIINLLNDRIIFSKIK